jgi:hypothetical protein
MVSRCPSDHLRRILLASDGSLKTPLVISKQGEEDTAVFPNQVASSGGSTYKVSIFICISN